MAITAAQVSELRRMTNCGMMDCKKALVETDGNIEEAADLLRKKGMMKAAKKADRIAAEGVITIATAADGKNAVIVEVNSETDFVARDKNFLDFVHSISQHALSKEVKDAENLLTLVVEEKKTIDNLRQELISKIGENINIRRLENLTTPYILGTYMHGHRIGVLVELEGGDESLAKDIAMHIAASKPLVVSTDQLPAEMLDKEREILTEQAKESGAPEQILEKMVSGRLKKYLDEVCLLGQPFVKAPDMTIEQLLKQSDAKVLRFVRFELGEGIEKKQENFAEEVMAQVKG